jgi:hypothetical protein
VRLLTEDAEISQLSVGGGIIRILSFLCPCFVRELLPKSYKKPLAGNGDAQGKIGTFVAELEPVSPEITLRIKRSRVRVAAGAF